MSKSRAPRLVKLSAALLIFFLSEIPVFYAGYYMGADSRGSEMQISNQTLRDVGTALSECTEEITGAKPHLFNYAASLEDENARLNAALREHRQPENEAIIEVR